MARMAPADAAWLHMDQPTNLMVVTAALWFDERPDWNRVREILAARLVGRFPKFAQRVVEGGTPLGVPGWEDDPRFDLDAHVERVTLPPPGDTAQLQSLVAEAMATPLDRSKPLWRFQLVDGYGNGAAIVGRIHHCIADGIALAHVLLSLADRDAEVEEADRGNGERGSLSSILAPATGALGALRGTAGAAVHEMVEVATHPEQFVDLAATARDDAAALAKVLLSGSAPQTPLKGKLGVPQRVAWSRPFPLDAVKEKGHASDTTVNDLMLAATAGALRSYLAARGSPVDELRAIVPFNLRPLDRPLPAELGNRFGLVLVQLPVGTEDRRGRLAEVQRHMAAIKHSHEGAASYGVLEALGSAPEQLERRLIDQYAEKGTAVITNIPGPAQPVYLAGASPRGILVWAPRSGSVPMSVTIFSYAGEITVGLATDAGLVPDPEEIVDELEAEVEALPG